MTNVSINDAVVNARRRVRVHAVERRMGGIGRGAMVVGRKEDLHSRDMITRRISPWRVAPKWQVPPLI